MIDSFDVQRFAVSAIGALTLSTACVFAAVGPAKAATPPQTVQAWQNRVEHNIGAAMIAPASLTDGKHALATVSLRFDADGRFAGAQLRQVSGGADVGRAALKVANRVAYPRLPESMQGKPQTVAMRLYFGKPADVTQADAMRAEARTLALAVKGDGGTNDNHVALAGL